mmetsp:Transcript_23251/g.45124  ORF Transcript_23251/g.45124 Transcript_23251/m.45124 type:complete len:93 (-) Transcript_23251:56-334(-)
MGQTPLHFAANNGEIESIKCLIENGAEKEAKDNDGRTPLHVAAEAGKMEVVKCLLELGAGKEAKEKDGKKPLDLISEYIREEKKAEMRVLLG